MQRIKTALWIEWGIALLVLAVLFWNTLPNFFAAQSINNPSYFPDPNFLAAVQEFMECGPNGRFLKSDAAEKKAMLNCRGRKIKSLEGIEYFTSVTGLDCSNNQLTALDVTKNSDLTFLNCSKNQLTHIDFSQNLGLTLLDLSSNQLDTMPDLTLHSKLRGIDVSLNNLTQDACEMIRLLEKRYKDTTRTTGNRVVYGILYSPQNEGVSLDCDE